MTKRIGVWRINDDGGQEVADPLQELRTTEAEERLEELLVSSPEILLPGLTLIGRQIPTAGGPLDLLGVDEQGRPVLFELKRGTLTRDAVAQILDYASDLQSKDEAEFASLVESNSGRYGIERMDDFVDWYQSEFPDVADRPPHDLRMILVGLGTDERARRVVNYLASGGLDIQLLTFQAFQLGGEWLLARQVETIEPSTRSDSGSSTKAGNLEILRQRAEELGVLELLFEVADFVEPRVPGYRWPGKTAITFSLQELTDEGRPSLRAYASVWIDERNPGHVIFSLPERGIEAASMMVAKLVEEVPVAERTSNAWMPFKITITSESWEDLREPLSDLLTKVVEGWRLKMAEAEGWDAE